MRTVTVNISFQERLLAEIDAEAERQSRTRSELLRAAARVYVERQRRWASLFRLGDGLQRRTKVTARLVASEISEYRAGRKAGRKLDRPKALCLTILWVLLLCSSQSLPAASEQTSTSLTNSTYIGLVNELDVVLSFDSDTPKTKVVAFKSLVTNTIPKHGKEIEPYLFDKILRSKDARIVAYAVAAISRIEKLTQKEEQALESKLKAAFPSYPADLTTDVGRAEVVSFLKGFFAGRNSASEDADSKKQ